MVVIPIWKKDVYKRQGGVVAGGQHHAGIRIEFTDGEGNFRGGPGAVEQVNVCLLYTSTEKSQNANAEQQGGGEHGMVRRNDGGGNGKSHGIRRQNVCCRWFLPSGA